MSASRDGQVIPPKPPGAKPPTCASCGNPVGGELVRVSFDGGLMCAGCDPSVPEE